jgi:hypothetical protein
MPRRNLFLAIAAAVVAVIALIAVVAVVAGGDDDDDDAVTEPDVSVEATDEAEETPEETAEPTGEDDKTPGPDETPGETEDAGPTPIEATPNPTGIRATIIENPTAWFEENYPGVSPGQEDCSYNVATVLVTCSGVDYAPDPPLVGAGAECFGLLVNNERVALRCTIPDVTTYYYDIIEE